MTSTVPHPSRCSVSAHALPEGQKTSGSDRSGAEDIGPYEFLRSCLTQADSVCSPMQSRKEGQRSEPNKVRGVGFKHLQCPLSCTQVPSGHPQSYQPWLGHRTFTPLRFRERWPRPLIHLHQRGHAVTTRGLR